MQFLSILRHLLPRLAKVVPAKSNQRFIPIPKRGQQFPLPCATPAAIDTTRTPDISRRTCETDSPTAFGTADNLPGAETIARHSCRQIIKSKGTTASADQSVSWMLFTSRPGNCRRSAAATSGEICTFSSGLIFTTVPAREFPASCRCNRAGTPAPHCP